MKITLAPLVVDARGRFGGIVFSNWKGIAVAREFVPPAQPRTANQLDIRNLFRNANSLWRRASSVQLAAGGMVESYSRAAYGQALVNRNVMIGLFADMLRSKANLADFAATFPNPRAPKPSGVTATNTGGTVRVAVTSLAAPSGLTLVGVGAYLVPEFNPEDANPNDAEKLRGDQTAQSTAGAGNVDFTNTPNGSYRAFGFAQYTDGRYPTSDARHREISPSASATVTVS